MTWGIALLRSVLLMVVAAIGIAVLWMLTGEDDR